MKAIIPAAGYATRLYPLTKDTPKQLLQIGDRKMIEHVVNKLEEIDEVDHIYIVTNDKFYGKFLEWNRGYSSHKDITIMNDGTKSNEDRLGAIGDIHYAVEKNKIDDDCWVIGGDNLFEFSLKDVLKFYRAKDSSIIAVRDLLDKKEVANKFGVVEIDDNHKIIGFEEKPAEPKSTLAATLVYMLKREDLAELYSIMEREDRPDNAGEFIKYLSSRRDVHSYAFDEAWYDIGNPEQLEEVGRLYGK